LIAVSQLLPNNPIMLIMLSECRMAKFDSEAMHKNKLMVTNLKSTGQSKFALDDANTKDEVISYSSFHSQMLI